MKDGAGELVKTGVTKLGGGKLVNQVSDLVTRIGSTKWAQAIGNIEKRANWNGSIGEMLEEEAGIVLNSMFVGDNKISDLVDPEQQIDIALGVGLFGGFVSGIKTAGYPVARYNARRNLNRADVRASELMGDKWDGLRNSIDDAEEGDLSSIVASVIAEEGMTGQKQRAVVDYARALMTSRGYNISSESVREDGMASAEEVGAVDSFDAGYSITDSQEMVDARLEMERQRMKLVSSMSEDIADEFDADPLDALARTYDPEIREIASKYVNAKMVYDGMIQRVRDDIDGRIAQSDAMIDGRVNRDTGMIQGATLTDGKEVYVVNGNVAMLDDGVNVDVENSDESLIVRDAEGRLEFVAPSQVQSLLAPVDAASEKEAAAEAIRNEIAQSAADKIDGVLHFAPNDVYAVINEDGTQESLTIVGESVDASGVAVDGMVDVMREDGSVVAMNTADIQRMVDESNARRLDERDKARESAEADSGVEAAGAAAEEPRPSALSRIPTDQNGEPLYEQVDADTAWDAFVEQSEGDEEIAREVVADIVAEKRKALADAEKALKSIGDSKPNASNGEGAITIQERIAAKMASKRALTDARDAVERAKGVVEHWQSIGDTVKRRAEAEEAERRRQAEIAAEEARQAAEQERAEREEAERLKREALNGVPDWGYDTAADARARGYRRAGAEKVDRPEIIDSHAIGKEVDVKFSDRDIVKGRVAIIDAGELQPSHIQGDRNPAHFLDEAQPKERNDAASVVSAQKIASNIRPEEITSSVTAYTGAPTVNSRGEVIQGNSRSDALRLMYESQRESAQRYRQYLVDHAADFGLTPEQIVSMESPVLVNVVDVDDNEAIRLGQFVAQDTESGGVERIKAKNAVQKMGDKVGNFANMLLSTTDEEATFAQLVDANGVEVLKWMNQQGFITDTQYASAFNSRGNLTGEAVNDLKGIMYQSIFTGGSTRLEEIFNKMPAKAQRAILATAFRDYDSASADRMIGEIQQSIIAFDALTGYEQFRDATNAEATQLAVEAWKRQYAFDDVSGESYLPSETFSNFALALAAMYKGHTQKHIQGVFNTMYDIIQGTEQDNLFEAADKTPKPLADAIRRVLNIDYQPIVKTITDNGTNGDTVLDIDSEDGQGGRPGSNADASGAEQDTRVAEPAVGGGGTTIDSGQGSELNNKSKAFNYFTGSIKDLISLAMESAKGLYKKIVAPISDRLRTDLAQRGIILTPDYNHVIDNNAIRHALKKHGGKHEEKRGQIPLTDIDFERIEDVVTNYDQIRIEQGKRNDINIIYSKTYEDGTTIFVEEKRDGRKELAAVTMWKKKNFTHTDANHEVTPISDLSEVSDGKGNALSAHNQINMEQSGISTDATKVAEPGQNTAGATDGGYTIDANAVTGMNDSQLSDEAPLSLDDMWSAVKPTSEETNATKEEISSSSGETPAASKPKNPSGNKLVTDEQYAELLAKMRKKMGGQLNMGVDPEILAIGSMMAVYHIEKGARKFTEYVKAMVADLGEKFPARYLKGFYKAAHEMIEDAAPEIAAEMDADGVVNSADIASIINDRVDAMATAAMVVEEEAAEGEREAAERKLKEERKAERTKAKMGKIGIFTNATKVAEPGQNTAGANVIAENKEKPKDKKSGKAKRKAAVTDGGLFDSVDIPAIAKPAQRSESELEGDSAVYQKREMQTVELVEEIGGVIESRVMMLQLDAESVKPLTMTDVKKMASKYDALEDISDTDLQELVELAMTQLTRSEALINIDGTAEQQRSAYDHIVNLYRIQPSLNARDSERLIKQQYSTPTPFGYVMGQFVRAGGKPVGSMLEPSAGNGALTITVHPSLVHVNDIDDARLANLRKLNYGNVTAQDALLPFGGDKVDVVMTNPPFGTVAEKVYNGVFKVSSLEGQMAINALEKMKDDGRAAIIIGGNTSYRTNGSMNPKDAAFFGYLYSNYNVADVINISGKALYSRSGTGYDVRMILIDGRKSGEFKRVYPPVKAKARAEQVTTFDELYKRIQNDIQQIQQMGNTPADVQREPGRAVDGKSSAHVRIGNDSQDTGSGRRPDKAGDVLGGTRGTDIAEPAPGDDGRRPAGVGNAERGDGTGVNDVQRTAVDGPGRGELDKGVGDGRGRSGNDESVAASSRPDGNRQRLAVKTALGDEKVAYPNQSDNGFTLMSVVPATQARVLQKSLGEVGDVDQYLVDELGYSSKDELYSYLAAEQIDSVALAIHQMNKGNAFIIGDMTGVGKGRQGAALIRYAVKHGKTPIYFTQKPTLFTDNYRDLVDIGSSNLRPFIMASVDSERSGDIVDAEGNVVYKIPSKKEKERVYKHIMEHGTLPDGYDYVLSTYSQIQNGVSDYRQNEDGTWSIENRKLPKKSKGYTPADHNGQMRRDALARLAEGNITILDESHTVGGDSGCGRYMQMLTSQAEGVTFLSATFAKRADNMPIYAQRTAIAEAGVKASELIAAIAKGGVTLQEIMSKQLVESGQMIRRERSFEGVTIDWLGVEEETDRRQREQFNEVAYIFNAIRNFQDDYITPIIEAKNEAAAEVGATVGHRQGAKDLGVKNVPFASKMYNLVNQLLFALKVDAVADRVIDNLRNGYKPVISFTNTMEGFLSSAPKGEAMDEIPNFSITLMRALDGVMRFTEKDADNNSDGGSISLNELSTEGRNAYNAIREKIMNLSADLPISPMDAIRMKIEDAGYSVAEITGREMQLNRNDAGRYVVEPRKDRDKKAAMRDFNSGKLDVLMINKSGSTGISLHASSKFDDQRQRVMVFAQFQSDINDEVQMRGRIDRSGQVTRGRYEYIMSTIPAEQRIQMMFKAKLKSLDANTTSSQKSKFNEIEIVDYLNKYGDEVVWEYMKEHPELEERLGDPLEMLHDGNDDGGPRVSEKEDTSKKPGCAGKVSRYLAFLSVEEQDEIFREITEAYRVKIQLLDDAGENDLEITTMPLRADTHKKQIWHEGENPGSGNAFADNTYVEEVEVDVLKKPMKRSEIAAATRKLAGNLYAERNGVMDWEHYAYNKGEEIHQFYQTKADEAFGKMKEAGENRIAKAREKAVVAATKARGRGENNFTDAEIQSLADTVANEEREKEEQKQNKRHNEIMAVNNRIQALLNRLRAEKIYVVPQDLKVTAEMFSQTFGTFVGFKFNNGYTLGSSTAIFATLDGRRKVELALSDPAIDNIISATEIAYRYSPKDIGAISMDNWDGKVPTQSRQKRYIITGNLLQALVDTEKGDRTRGNLISFSTIDGETRQGILMGENFKPADLRSSASLSSRLNQIRDGKVVVSENGDVQIAKEVFDWRHRGQYELRVPKSKQRGGIYTMHPELLELVEDGNFTTKGNSMVGYILPENIVKAVDMLSRAPFNVTVLEESTLTDAKEDGLRYRTVNDVEAINNRFNDDLSRYERNELPSGFRFELGRPSKELISAGFPDLPISMRASLLSRKAGMERHPFNAVELTDLVKSIQRPIAVFNYTKSNIRNLIVDAEHEGKHFLIGVTLNYNSNGLEINSVSGIFPKESHEWIKWIQDGKTLRIDGKEKVLSILDSLRTNPAESERIGLNLESVAKVIKTFENPTVEGEEKLERGGTGAYSDAEVSIENDPWSKAWGESLRSKKEQRAFAERERERMRERVESLSKLLGIKIDIVEDGTALDGKKRKAKGWYDTRTGKITVVVGNHKSTADIEATVLHEAVAHHGLRELLGEYFDEFLDKVYELADREVKERIALLASRNGWNTRVAVEEYLASLAEDTDFENAKAYNGWWQKIKRAFLDMLSTIGFKNLNTRLTDNELRYILWRSYENMVNPGRYRAFEWEAEDVAMKHSLQVGEYADKSKGFQQLSSAKTNSQAIAAETQSPAAKTEEIQDIIAKLRMNPVAFDYVDLDNAAKIVENFKNPTIREQNNNAGESVDDGVRYRMGDFTPRDRKIAADVYDKMVSSARFEFSEAMQDSEEGKKYLTAKSFFKSKEGVSQRAMLLHEYSTPTFVTDGATLFNDTKIPNFLIFRLI